MSFPFRAHVRPDTFSLLAFLFHTLLELLDASYRRLRAFLPRLSLPALLERNCRK